MNMIHIAGHLGADPEVRHTPSGQKVTVLRVAVNIRKGGKEDTIWYRVTIWGDRLDKMVSYLKKGSGVMVFGELHKPEIYTDKEGRQQVSMEITAESIRFNPFGRSSQEQSQGQGGSHAQSQAASTYASQDSYSEPAYSAPRQTGYQSGGSANASSYNSFAMEGEEPIPF